MASLFDIATEPALHSLKPYRAQLQLDSSFYSFECERLFHHIAIVHAWPLASLRCGCCYCTVQIGIGIGPGPPIHCRRDSGQLHARYNRIYAGDRSDPTTHIAIIPPQCCAYLLPTRLSSLNQQSFGDLLSQYPTCPKSRVHRQMPRDLRLNELEGGRKGVVQDV